MITETQVRKFLSVLDSGLSSGLGEPEPGKMCIEAAWCYALGLPHGDDPGCVAEPVRKLKIRLNDANWSSNAARAKGLRRLGVIQVGTKGTIDEAKFAKRAATASIRICVPFALRAAAKVATGEHVKALLDAALLCQNAPTYDNAVSAKKAAADADAYAAYADAARAAAYAAAAAADADDDAARAAAYAAAAAAAAPAAAYAARAAGRDAMLSEFAEAIVQILIELKSPGTQWLELAE